jgi:hypothetical protein
MILRGLLEGPGNGGLFLAEPAIEVDLVFLFQVPADEVESAIRSPSSSILGSLPLGALENPLLSTR